MMKSKKSGYVAQIFSVNGNTKNGIFTDEPIQGYEELLSLEADTEVTLTLSTGETQSFTLHQGAHIGLEDTSTITTTKNVLIS